VADVFYIKTDQDKVTDPEQIEEIKKLCCSGWMGFEVHTVSEEKSTMESVPKEMPIGWLTLNRPDKRNALSLELMGHAG
jgi:hypothetical protein